MSLLVHFKWPLNILIFHVFQMSLIVAVNVIGQRMDFYALLHSVALMAVVSRRRRKAIGEVWPKYCCFTAGLIVLQYFICIGIPPALCVGTAEFLKKSECAESRRSRHSKISTELRRIGL